MTGLIQDLRYAVRRLRTSPGFTLVVIVTLSLGIGANTVVFSGISSLLRRIVRELDPDLPRLPLQKPMTQAAQFAESYVTPRLFARLAMGFGVLALALVASGLYGTLAYRVQRRTNEIGVRMALGARRGIVLWLVARERLLILSIGVASGLPISFFVSQFLRSQLHELSYLAGISFAVAIALTIFVAIVAALLPARRAAKIDPIVALRYE